MNNQLSMFGKELPTTESYMDRLEGNAKIAFEAYNEIDYTSLFRLVDEMNTLGIKVNEKRLDAHIEAQKEKVNEIAKTWDDELEVQGCAPINISKRAELNKLFFEVLGLPIMKVSASGAPSLDKKILDVLGGFNPLPRIYKEQKSAKRVLKMLQNIKNEVMEGRIYPQLHIDGAASGRFTCDGVNIQQFPEFIRDILEPDRDRLVYIDYSQIEYRVQATMANDQRAIEAFEDGVDAHQQLAELLGITREKAKIVNYAVSYGMTPFGLSIELGISEEEAADVINNFWEAKDKVAKYRKEVIEKAKERGIATTLYGFSREVAKLEKDDQIWSTVIQGSAADLMKKTMVKVDEYLKHYDCGRIVANMHDALLIDLEGMAHVQSLEAIFNTIDTRFVLNVETVILGE
jgi:DNA polymerase-1